MERVVTGLVVFVGGLILYSKPIDIIGRNEYKGQKRKMNAPKEKIEPPKKAYKKLLKDSCKTLAFNELAL